jgi:hypothetical protein
MHPLPPAWVETCACGRSFSVPQAYTYHKRSCQKTKKQLAGVLRKAKEVWQARKRFRVEEIPTKEAATDFDVPTTPVTTPTVRPLLILF